MSLDAARLERLLDRYLDEALTPEEKVELEQMLHASAEARQMFWQHARFHALLREAGAEDRGRELAEEPSVTRWQLLCEAVGHFFSNAGWAATATALVMIFAGLAWNWRFRDAAHDQTTAGVAVLTQAIDLEWAANAEPHATGGALSPGWLRIKSGLAQIEFNNGARVILEGPAELEIRSRSEAFCQSGRLSAQVPPAAQGFKISSPKLNVIDLGTAFGFEARPDHAEVHVFEGKVQLESPGKYPHRELLAGQGLAVNDRGEWRDLLVASDVFPSADALEERATSSWQRRDTEWRSAVSTLHAEPSLLLQYSFEATSPFDRRLRNGALGAINAVRASEGAIVGCHWAEGRWPGKQALEFKGVGDRVCLELPGQYETLTLAAWVRVDSLDHPFNSLLMADGYSPGKLHWQITRSGVVRLGMSQTADVDTPVIFLPERLGQWVHLAVVIDRTSGWVRHYVDGQEAAALQVRSKVPVAFGRAEVGNWNPETLKDRTPIRGFNGRMDEMLVFSRALSAPEVRGLSRIGPSPQLAFQ